MTAPKPTSAGRLARTPLPNLLIYLLDHSSSGTLIVEAPSGEKSAAYLNSGVVSKLRVASGDARLGELLVEMGAVPSSSIEQALASGSGPLGQRLLTSQQIDAATLQTALAEQLKRRLVALCGLPPNSAFGYYDGQDFLAALPPGPEMEPLQLVWSCIEQGAAQPQIQAVLQQIAQRPLRLHPAARVQRFGFPRQVTGALDVLRAKPHSLPELTATGLVEAALLGRVVYTLAMTRHLQLGEDAKPPVGVVAAAPAQRPAAPAATSEPKSRPLRPQPKPEKGPTANPPNAAMKAGDDGPAEDAELKAELSELIERMPAMSYYELLGVPDDANASAIQSAFFQLAKKWHPDKVAGKLASQRDAAARLFARLSEAHQTLSNDERRREYDAMVSKGGGDSDEQEKVQRVLRAATAFQKAEILLRKGDTAGAINLSKQAFDTDPEQPEYGAFHAWVTARSEERSRSRKYDDLLGILAGAVKQAPANARILFYSADVLKRAGRTDEAMKAFRKVTEMDPNNVDAAREVRLFRMRREAEKGERDTGLLGRLFKR